jgi:methyl-accepting chemotaxis protein
MQLNCKSVSILVRHGIQVIARSQVVFDLRAVRPAGRRHHRLVRLQHPQNAELTEAVSTASRAALNVERINSLVYAVVMESRGVYMSTIRRW